MITSASSLFSGIKKIKKLNICTNTVTAPILMQLGLHPGCCGISNVHAQPNLSFSHSPEGDIVWAELLALTDCDRYCCELPTVAQPGSALGMLHSGNIQLQCGALKWETITIKWEFVIHGKLEELRDGEFHGKDLLPKATSIRRSPEETDKSTVS